MKKMHERMCWAENCTCTHPEHIKISNLLTVSCRTHYFKASTVILGCFQTLLEDQSRFSFLPQLLRGNFGKWKKERKCLMLFS